MPSPTHDELPAIPVRRSITFWWTALAMALAALDLSGHLFRDWVPHDEGALGLAAALVRSGLWPHEGFTDIYSGGLALLDAGAQSLFGDSIRTLRIPLAIASIGWVGVLAACFRRFASPPAAAGMALLAFLWGPPLYPAPIPSWYLLFLATGVVWCLLRWQETGRARWWGGVGALIALGIFVKINAIFMLAGAGIVLLVGGPRREGAPSTLGGGRVAAGAVAVVILLGVLGACFVVQRGWGWSYSWILALPLLVLGLAAAGRAWASPGTAREQLTPLVAPLLFLLAGLSVVLVPWITAYWARGALAPLIQGVLVLPFRRSEFARMLPPPADWMDLVVGVGFALMLRPPRASRIARWVALGVVLVAAWSVWRGRENDVPVIVTGWRILRICGITTLVLAVALGTQRDGRERQGLLVVAAMASWFALLQYPFAAPIYFVYVAPLLLLAAAAVAHVLATPRPVALALGLAAGAWTLGVGHGQSLYMLGWRFHPPLPYVTLAMPRGGIEVPFWEAAEYAGTFEVLDRWGARRIVAGPDAPEMYYLGERHFPDREFFEFMAPDWSAKTFARRIKAQRPDAVVLNSRPGFSKIDLDSIVAALPAPWRGDTTIGRFRLILLPRTDAPP